MLRRGLLLLILLTACSAVAQQGVWDTGVGWLKKAWTQVQEEGKPAAEHVIKQFPARFKSVPNQVAALRKKIEKGAAGMKLQEKKVLITELWRIRRCIDLMSLIDSGLLEQLTGIDTKVLKSTGVQVLKLQSALQMKKA